MWTSYGSQWIPKHVADGCTYSGEGGQSSEKNHSEGRHNSILLGFVVPSDDCNDCKLFMLSPNWRKTQIDLFLRSA